MRDELNPCPISGGNGQVIACDASPEYPDGGLYGAYYVKCQQCGAYTYAVYTRANAISEWNQRHLKLESYIY